MNTITIELPEHAVRYPRRMCEVERNWLASHTDSLQTMAAFDCLNAIESALPEPENRS